MADKYGFWHAGCKCEETSEIADHNKKLTRDQANKIFRERGWLIADNSDQEDSAVCPGCQPK